MQRALLFRLAVLLLFESTSKILGQVSDGEDREETVRVVIGFPDEIQQSRFEAVAGSDRSLDFQNWVRYNRTNAIALTLPVSQLDALLLEQTRSSSSFSYVEKDRISRLYGETTPYGISAVQGDMPISLGVSTTASNDDCFKICVIDSGLMVAHPDIPFEKGSNNIMGEEFGLGGDSPWFDPSSDSSHGTHVTVRQQTHNVPCL